MMKILTTNGCQSSPEEFVEHLVVVSLKWQNFEILFFNDILRCPNFPVPKLLVPKLPGAQTSPRRCEKTCARSGRSDSLRKLDTRSGRSDSLRTMWAILKAAALFYFLIPCTNENALKEVGDFMQEFASLTDSSAEVLDKLALIGSGTFSLLKFAGPIAQIVHAGISAVLSADSEESVAINNLQSTITDKFAKLSRKIDDVIARREYSAAMNTYGLLISLNLGQLEHMMSSAISTGSKRYVEAFTHTCQHREHTPGSLLKWINSSTNTNCRRPSKSEAEVYTKAYQLIGKVTERLAGEQSSALLRSEDYTLWKTDMLIKFTDLPLKVARKHLLVIEKALTALNFTKVMTVTDLSQRFAGVLTNTAFGVGDLFAETHRRRRSGTYFECFLRTIATRFERRREPLIDISGIIVTDVIRLQLIGIMCASVVAKGDSIYYERELEVHDQLTRDIANGMRMWILAELDSAWPEIITTHCSDAMGSNDEPINENKYEKLAAHIRHAANERGNQNFLHQIIVAPLWEEPFFLKECNAETCVSYSKRGVRVLITRFNESDEQLPSRLVLSQDWIKDNRHTIQSEIKNQLNLLGGKANLSLILSNVSKKFKRKHLTGIYLWRNLLFLHNRKWFAKECVIPVGIAGTSIQGTSAYDNNTETFDEPKFALSGHPSIVRFCHAAQLGGGGSAEQKRRPPSPSQHHFAEFLVLTELCAGGPLIDVMRRGPFSVEQVCKIFHATAQAVLHMHDRNPPITHRDIKSLRKSLFIRNSRRKLDEPVLSADQMLVLLNEQPSMTIPGQRVAAATHSEPPSGSAAPATAATSTSSTTATGNNNASFLMDQGLSLLKTLKEKSSAATMLSDQFKAQLGLHQSPAQSRAESSRAKNGGGAAAKIAPPRPPAPPLFTTRPVQRMFVEENGAASDSDHRLNLNADTKQSKQQQQRRTTQTPVDDFFSSLAWEADSGSRSSKDRSHRLHHQRHEQEQNLLSSEPDICFGPNLLENARGEQQQRVVVDVPVPSAADQLLLLLHDEQQSTIPAGRQRATANVQPTEILTNPGGEPLQAETFGAASSLLSDAATTTSSSSTTTTTAATDNASDPKKSQKAGGNFDDILSSVYGFTSSTKLSTRSLADMSKESDNRDMDPLSIQIRDWTSGKERNIRALLGSLNAVLWPEAAQALKQPTVAELYVAENIRKHYLRACLVVHPDKQHPGSVHIPLARAIFTELNNAWTEFQRNNDF
uniref:Uncharacterized protein n=1 Tax=Globodera rostochiensis TaxID=31243 RepID=A0A914HPH4_GLORO